MSGNHPFDMYLICISPASPRNPSYRFISCSCSYKGNRGTRGQACGGGVGTAGGGALLLILLLLSILYPVWWGGDGSSGGGRAGRRAARISTFCSWMSKSNLEQRDWHMNLRPFSKNRKSVLRETSHTLNPCSKGATVHAVAVRARRNSTSRLCAARVVISVHK